MTNSAGGWKTTEVQVIIIFRNKSSQIFLRMAKVFDLEDRHRIVATTTLRAMTILSQQYDGDNGNNDNNI